jgi:hypothetical protein
MTAVVRAEHVRSLLRVAGEGHEHAAAGQDPRRHVLEGLARVVSAEVGILLTGRLATTTVALDEWLDHGWRTPRERAAFCEFYATEPTADPAVADMMRSPRSYTTQVRPVPRLEDELYRPASLASSLMSFVRDPDGEFRIVVFKRARGSRRFDDEDCALVDLFRAEFEHLFTPVREPALSRREREVLALLMVCPRS